MRIPIACSLDAGAARAQAGEWDAVVAGAATVSRPRPTELLVRLPDDHDAVVGILDLARREKACCPFFDLSLLIGADGLTLRVAVPEDAVAILDDLGGARS